MTVSTTSLDARTPVDVVAHEDDGVPRPVDIKKIHQRQELVQASVDVADGKLYSWLPPFAGFRHSGFRIRGKNSFSIDPDA